MHQWHVISLLIRGILPVNARLLIAFGTAFYAIIHDKKLQADTLVRSVLHSDIYVSITFYSIDHIDIDIKGMR